MQEKYKSMSNVPNLRFPGFNGDENGSYRKHFFKDIFLFSTGKNIKQNEASPEFETPCVRYGELYHMYNEVINEVINKTNLDISELLFSQGDEILLPSAGEDPLDIGSASALMVENVAIGRTINILKPMTANVYSQIYVAYYINQKLRKKISTLAKGSSISNVYNSDLKTLEIILPSLNEQQKTATFLSLIDDRIQTQIKIIENLKTLIKVTSEKIFKQKLRFKDDFENNFPDWQVKKLEDVCEIAKSGGTPTSTNKSYYNGNIPFLSISDMTSQGKYLTKTSNSISKLGLENSSSWLVPQYSLIYSMYASVGFVAINKIPIATSQAVLNLILKKEVNLEFMYYTLIDFQKNIAQFITTGTQGNLNAQSVKNFNISIPSFSEQTKIATFLSQIDAKIEIEKQLLTQYENQKKYLMQNLFI